MPTYSPKKLFSLFQRTYTTSAPSTPPSRTGEEPARPPNGPLNSHPPTPPLPRRSPRRIKSVQNLRLKRRLTALDDMVRAGRDVKELKEAEAGAGRLRAKTVGAVAAGGNEVKPKVVRRVSGFERLK